MSTYETKPVDYDCDSFSNYFSDERPFYQAQHKLYLIS